MWPFLLVVGCVYGGGKQTQRLFRPTKDELGLKFRLEFDNNISNAREGRYCVFFINELKKRNKHISRRKCNFWQFRVVIPYLHEFYYGRNKVFISFIQEWNDSIQARMEWQLHSCRNGMAPLWLEGNEDFYLCLMKCHSTPTLRKYATHLLPTPIFGHSESSCACKTLFLSSDMPIIYFVIFSCDNELKKWQCHFVCLSVCLRVCWSSYLFSCQLCFFEPLHLWTFVSLQCVRCNA